MGREVFYLLCDQTMALTSYKESFLCLPFLFVVEHEYYGTSAYFGIYLKVCKNGKRYYLEGNLLLSLTSFNRAKPVIILQKDNSMVAFPFLF